MPYIRTVSDDEAEGALARLFEAARRRAGRVFGVVRVQSLNAPVLNASMNLYQLAVLGESPLSRAEREMIAVVVSAANDCFY